MKKHLLLSAVALAAASLSVNAADVVYYHVGDEVTVGVNTYKVTSENLIPNYSFDEGFTGWTDNKAAEITADHWTIADEGGADGGKYLYSTNGSGGGSGAAGSMITGFQLEAGKTYYVSCYTMKSGSNTRFSLGTAFNTKTDNNIVFKGSNADSWEKGEGIINAKEDGNYLNFVAAWLNAGAAFDCFQLVEIEFLSTTEVTFPVALGVEYTIKETHNGAYLSANETQLTVQEKGAADWCQAFIFEKAYDNENLYIKSADGKYIKKAGNPWDPELVDAPEESNSGVFNLVQNEDGTYSIKVLSSQFFGINAGDAFAAGSNIYFDKSAADARCTFEIAPNVSFPVDLGVEYQLVEQKTGAYLSTDDKALSIQNKDAEGFNQSFTFELGHDYKNLYIKGNDGKYLALGGNPWTAVLVSDPTDNDKALFNVEVAENGYSIKVLASQHMGLDKFEAGSTVYLDKNGDKQAWFKLLRADGSLSLTALNNAIAEAEGLLASTVEGDEPGNYPADARQTLTAAIETAKAALEAISQDEVDSAAQALNAAIAAYKACKVPAVFEAGVYNFKQAVSEAYLSTGWHANSWESGNNEQTALYLNKDEASYNQNIEVVKAPADAAGLGYNLMVENGAYLYNKGGKLYWNAETDPKALDAIFTFDTIGENVTITNAATGKFVGPNDNTKGWTWIHAGTNHTGKEDGHLFVATKVGEPTGISAVAVENADAPVEYYNLQGIRVANPENGLYIRRQGNKAVKVLVK